MSTPINPSSYPNSVPSLQESGSLAGRVVTKVHTTASYFISSIGFVAESILSNCIYVGTLGHYTIDDLKSCFPVKDSLENKNIEKESLNETDRSLEKDQEFSQSRLNRHPSKISVNSQTFRRIHAGGSTDSPYRMGFQQMSEMIKLSMPSDVSKAPKSSFLKE